MSWNMKWKKALNGYYYTVDEDATYAIYTIEVTTNLKGVTTYAPTINFKDGDYGYLRGWPHNTLREAKAYTKKHFLENEHNIQNIIHRRKLK